MSRANRDHTVLVKVRLFGILGVLARERLVALQVTAGATLADVLLELEGRFGPDFTDRILRVPGEMHTYCQVFVNDTRVTRLDMEVKADGAAAEVEMILLMASDGG